MRSIKQKAEAYKRSVIRNFAPFIKNGMLTPSELEFMANGATVKALESLR